VGMEVLTADREDFELKKRGEARTMDKERPESFARGEKKA